MSSNVPCIFCNHRKPGSDEDIIPQWLDNELGPTGQITTDFVTVMPGQPAQSRQRVSGNLATLKLTRVCRDCNTQWMSNLENKTKPLLIPLIRGNSRSLDESEQRQIAAWCQLKALTLDAYYQKTYGGFQFLPARVAHEFGQLSQPLATSTVNLGRYLPPAKGVMLPWARCMKSTPPTDQAPRLDVVIVTFGFGHLAIQVSIGEWHEPFPYRPLYNLATPVGAPVTQQCWPTLTNDLQWPSQSTITASNFHSITRPVITLTALT